MTATQPNWVIISDAPLRQRVSGTYCTMYSCKLELMFVINMTEKLSQRAITAVHMHAAYIIHPVASDTLRSKCSSFNSWSCQSMRSWYLCHSRIITCLLSLTLQAQHQMIYRGLKADDRSKFIPTPGNYNTVTSMNIAIKYKQCYP